MSDTNSFTKLVPGFDFLQGLVKNAGAALPGIGQWVAPTLDPAELEKRIEELRTVQFWLEQNARMMGATIQALEVQRMTLSTLKTMNVQMSDLRDSLKITLPDRQAASGDVAEPSATASAPPDATGKAARSAQSEADAVPAIDPMQWWGALTKQFTQLAATAMKDSATDAGKGLAGAGAKQGVEAAGQPLKNDARVPANVARKAAAARKRSTR